MTFRKHLVIPVIPAPVTTVHAFVEHELRQLKVFRPDPYDQLTIVSHETVSKHCAAHGLRPTAIARKWIEACAPPAQIDGYFHDTRYYEPNNISHLLTHIIPLCLLSSRAVDNKIVHVFRTLHPRFVDLLNFFGITPFCTRRPVQGIAVETFLSRNLDQYISYRAPDPVTSLVEDIYPDVPNKGAKIYLSRKGARSLTNEDDVRMLLEFRGYSTIYMEDWSIPEQIAIAQSASDVVAIHGAAMGYLTLNSGLNSVIELMPNHVGTAFFPIALGPKVGSYWQLISKFSDNVQFEGWAAIEAHKNAPFDANLDHLRSAIDSTGN